MLNSIFFKQNLYFRKQKVTHVVLLLKHPNPERLAFFRSRNPGIVILIFSNTKKLNVLYELFSGLFFKDFINKNEYLPRERINEKNKSSMGSFFNTTCEFRTLKDKDITPVLSKVRKLL